MILDYFPVVWINLLQDIRTNGQEVSPRGHLTLEILQKTIEVNMRHPVLTVPERGINTRFMAAEAYWILTGDNRTETIVPYNSRIADFSDDGVTYFGAYGPKIEDQLPYVLDTLTRDCNSRQAGLTIWREKPPLTKDVPCTVAIFFNIRDSRLNVNVFMRSSDAWLGVPYDVFNFSMLGHLVCAHLNQVPGTRPVAPGTLYLTAASSHLYQSNWGGTDVCLEEDTFTHQAETPEPMWKDPVFLLKRLKLLRERGNENLRWWAT